MTQSNEPTIEQMNLVIADFMGYYFLAGKFYSKEKGNTYSWFKDAKYHISWDWLMPVVEKIENMPASIRIENRINQMDADHLVTIWIDPEDQPIIQTCENSKMEAVHKAAYQFITWYNQQTTTNDNTERTDSK